MATMKFKVQKGPRGGQFYIDETGKKHYIKKTTKKYVERVVLTSTEIKKVEKQVEKVTEKVKKTLTDSKKTLTEVKTAPVIEEPKMKRWICYYEERVDGELVDDFKEWCEAATEADARNYFKDNYSHNPNVEISMIIEEK